MDDKAAAVFPHLQGYIVPSAPGGVTFNIGRITHDLALICVASRITRQEFQDTVMAIFDIVAEHGIVEETTH